MDNKKGFIKILLVIVAIVVVTLFVYAQMGSRTKNEKDVTADWKTYRNDKYGFEVKYPTGYDFSENNDFRGLSEFNVGFLNSKLKSEIESGTASVWLPPWIVVQYDKSKNVGWEKRLYNFFGFSDTSSDMQIKLLIENPEEIKNLPVTDPVKFIVEPVLSIPSGYAFRKNNYDVLIYTSMDTDEESKMNLEKMLSTFKFTK